MKEATNPIKKSIATKMLLVVLTVYLVIALLVSFSHLWMNYDYQKENIIQELKNIEKAFANPIAVNLWGLDEEALHATVEGMLLVPTLVGVSINTEKGATVAIAGIVKENGESGNVGLHVKLAGLNLSKIEIPPNEQYKYGLFSRQFPIEYRVKDERIALGQVTIYSNSTVIYKRMKLQGFMLAFDIALTLVTFTIALLWVFNRYLRGPLTTLATASGEVRLENLDSYKVNIGISDQNELKVLEESFNSMIDTLHQSIVEKKRIEGDMIFTKFAVDHISDAAFWIDADGRFAYVNDAACRSLEYSQEELLGMSVNDVDPNFPVNAWASHWQEVKTKGSFKFETFHSTKGGMTFPVEVVVNFMKFEGREYNCAFVRNISDRKAMEFQLQQSQKMEAIGTLAGGIAHDFNNILAAVIGYAELVQVELTTGSELWSNQQQVLNAGNRAKELVKQILTFSRQSEGERKPLQVHLIVKEALKLLRASIPTTIEIRENIDTKSGTILADPTQIHQIMMNICTNAYHAMRTSGGVLGVELSQVDISKQESKVSALHLAPGPYLLLKVSDSGHGMDRATRERIFDPYFTTKKTGEGTGMGLAVVHGIVKSYGGYISVYSEPGKGSSFQIYLPKVMATAIETEERHNGDIPTGNERILLVDDDESILMMGQRILEQLGYRVTTMLSSKDALHVFSNQPQNFDLVVTDMTMPDMTGALLSQKILAIRPDVPIIMCTGFSDLINEDKAKAIGIREYVMKPIVRSEMARVVRNVLDES